MKNQRKNLIVFFTLATFWQLQTAIADVLVSESQPQFLKKESLKDFNKNNSVRVGIDNPFEKLGKVELIYLDRFSELLKILPVNAHKTSFLTFSSDEDGKYFAINTDLGNFLVSYETKSIVFELLPPYTQKVIYVSPNSKYFVLATEQDGISFTDFYDLSTKDKVFTADGDLMVDHFMGADDGYVFGNYKGRDGLIDLKNPKKFSQISPDDVPRPGQYSSLGPDRVLGYSEKLDQMVIWDLPSMSVEKSFESLPKGVPFSNNSGTIVGSFDENKVFFCDLKSETVKGFAFSNLDQNIFMEMAPGKRRVKTIKEGVAGWRTFDTFEVVKMHDVAKNETKEFSPSDEGDQKKTEMHLARSEGTGNYFVVSGVDPDESGDGFYVRFTLWSEGKNAKPPCSQIAHFDGNLNLDKIIHFSVPLLPSYKFDSKTDRILGISRDGIHYKFDLK